MAREEKIEIYGLSRDGVAYKEAIGLSIVWDAYAENCAGEYIMTSGFNANSGYVYIALENGVSICSMLGSDVEYLVANPYTNEEDFFDSYEEALEHMEKSYDDFE